MRSKMYKIQLLQVFLGIWIGTIAAFTTDYPSVSSSSVNPADAAIVNTEESILMSPGEQVPTASNPLVPTASNPLEKTCQAFHCMGHHCYRNESIFQDATNATCPTYCELYHHNSSHYEARCNPNCLLHMCNDTVQDECSLYCCNTSLCMTLDYVFDNNNNKTMTNTTSMSTAAPVPSTTLATTTTTTKIVYSDKKCRSFQCTGTDCYKQQVQATVKQCAVGINHCELQKVLSGSTVSYEGGCSNTCSTSTKSCAVITSGNCFQECCNATSAGCCMKLDGQVHFNTAAVHRSSLLTILTCALIVIFMSRYFSISRV